MQVSTKIQNKNRNVLEVGGKYFTLSTHAKHFPAKNLL